MPRLVGFAVVAALVLVLSGRPNPSYSAVAGLVAAYSFDQSSGTTVTDVSGSGRTGTLSGGATWAPGGKYGGAVSFDGVNDLVIVSDANSLDVTRMTLSAWVKPTTLSGWKTAVMKEGSGNLAYALYANTSGNTPEGEIRTSKNYAAVGGSKLPNDTWTYLTATYDGSKLLLYVNGTQVATLNATGNLTATTGALVIGGNRVWGSEYFNGLIDEVRVYNRALTVAEIQADMTAPLGADLVAPTASITGPATTPLSGIVTLTANAADNVAVAGVQFFINGQPIGTEDTTSPYSASWNTTTYANATYAITARARDAAGNQTTSAPVNMVVSNLADTAPPQVSMTAPAVGANVSGNVSLQANASDDIGVVGVQFLLDGANLGLEDTSAPYATSWSASTATSGSHTLTAVARDASGKTAVSPPVTVNVVDPNSPDQVGAWSPVMNWPLVAVHSTLMPDGKILMWDGWEYGTTTAKVWDPATNQFTAVAIDSQIFCAAHSFLPDGRILVTGGHNGGGVGIDDASIFNPFTRAWTRIEDMKQPRWYPTSITLGDGRILVLSGEIVSNLWADFPEIYSPYSNTWATMTANTGSMRDPEYPLAFLLPNGNIMSIAATPGTHHLLDVRNQTWSNLGPVQKLGSAASYLPGKIMYSGGGNDSPTSPSSNLTWVIDATQASPAWRTVAPMHYGRYNHNLIVLPDGNLMALGGSTTQTQTATTGVLVPELWNPATETWKDLAAMAQPRMYHSTALLLPDGRVLAAGGGRWLTATNYLSAEIYSPPYLFKGPRPAITGAPASATHGSTITVSTPDAASITSVSLVGLGSVTHTIDMNQHFVPLSFTAGANSLSVTIPANSSVAPPGPYMLFINNNQGVPSVASMISVTVQTEAVPPSVTITLPTAGATLSGTVAQLTATASDNTGVGWVEFFAGATSIGRTSSPGQFTVAWDTTKVANGPYTITAVAEDVFGNRTTSAPVQVTVSNQASTVVGLVLALGFNEGAGTSAHDSSSYNNNGTVFEATWTAGRYGQALNFDGVNDWVTVADSLSLRLTSGMTIEAWLKPTTLSGWKTAVMKERPSALDYALYANAGGNLPAAEIWTTTVRTATGTSQLPLSAWTHLATTYDGANLKLYVNGVLVKTTPSTGNIGLSTSPVHIGGNATWLDEFFKGVIDEVRIYNRTLTPSEITTDMNTPIP